MDSLIESRILQLYVDMTIGITNRTTRHAVVMAESDASAVILWFVEVLVTDGEVQHTGCSEFGHV